MNIKVNSQQVSPRDFFDLKDKARPDKKEWKSILKDTYIEELRADKLDETLEIIREVEFANDPTRLRKLAMY